MKGCIITYDYIITVDTGNICQGCEYPICSERCASTHSNHTKKECEILARCPEELRPDILKLNKDKEKSSHAYSIITPLRMLLLQERDTDEWRRSDQLIDHITGKNFSSSGLLKLV